MIVHDWHQEWGGHSSWWIDSLPRRPRRKHNFAKCIVWRGCHSQLRQIYDSDWFSLYLRFTRLLPRDISSTIELWQKTWASIFSVRGQVLRSSLHCWLTLDKMDGNITIIEHEQKHLVHLELLKAQNHVWWTKSKKIQIALDQFVLKLIQIHYMQIWYIQFWWNQTHDANCSTPIRT